MGSQWAQTEDFASAIEKVKDRGVEIVHPVSLCSMADLSYQNQSVLRIANTAQFNTHLKEYISTLDKWPVTDLESLIAWNAAHAETAMPEPYLAQDEFIDLLARSKTLDPKFVEDAIEHGTRTARESVDRCLRDNGIDVIVAPGDSAICIHASLAGYPSDMVPMTKLRGEKGMGQPQGLMIIAGEGGEGKMLKFMEMWEGIVGPFQGPEMARI